MSKTMQQDAKAIAEHLLQVTGSALLSGDFALFQGSFNLPQVMAVAETRVRVETPEDLEAIFKQMHLHMTSTGVTEIRRVCEFAEFVEPNKIRSTHITHLMSGDTALQAPYPVSSMLVCENGTWKVGSADYNLEPGGSQARAILRPYGRVQNSTSLFKKMSSLRDQTPDLQAIAIYQANLDAVSAAILEGPSEAALEHLRAPYFMRTSKGLEAFNNSADIIAGIDSARLSLRVQGATDYVRTTDHAYFRNENEIEGIHTTRILRVNELMTPPYENRMKLVRSAEGKWQVIHAEHTNVVSGWPTTLRSDTQPHKIESINPLSQADEIARLVYQEYLDALTLSNTTHDFDGWVNLCDFPHTVIIDRVTREIEDPKDIKPFFEMVSGLVNDNPTATMKRHGEFATFVDSHTIRGYHCTTFRDEKSEVFPPVRGRFTIVLKDNRWCMTETVNSIANTEFPYSKPIVSEALGSEMDQKKDLTR